MKDEKSPALRRREFLSVLGAGAGAAAIAGGSRGAAAQATSDKADAKSAAPLKIVDFHNHYVGPSFALTTMAAALPRCGNTGKGSIAIWPTRARSSRRSRRRGSPPG